MPGLSSLEIAKRGLQAQQYALDVTSNNIANINTEGYSRRTAIMKETSPLISEGMSYGTGVLVEGVQTYRMEFFDKEIRSNMSSLSGVDTDVEVYKKIEAILAEPSQEALAETITEFFTAFDKLGMTPEDEALRLYTVELTQTMCEQFNTVSAKLGELKNDIQDEMDAQVLLANNLIKDIGNLNYAIGKSGAETGMDIQTYYDEREVKLEKLSEIMDVSVAVQSDGQANVYVNGINIISDNDVSEIKLRSSIDEETKEVSLKMYSYDEVKDKFTKLEPNTGKMASYMKHFNETLDPNEQSSTAMSVIRSVDQLANAMATKVNEISVSGYGLDDSDAPSRVYFNEFDSEPINAANISINQDIMKDPRTMPLASEPGVSGNNDIALKIARLGQDSTFIGDQTANEFYSGFVGQFATYTQYAESNQSRMQLVSNQLENQRQSMIGVNEDEEAISLVKFQRVYESCSRLVTTLNEMLQVLVNLGQ
jgi:flagellar hook-associated protein 1 FlgK